MLTIAEAADVRLLIVDEQSPSVGSRSGRRRGEQQAAETDGRFLEATAASGSAALRAASHCVILHRSRRQHYTPVFYQGRGKVAIADLPSATRALWPRLEDHAGESSAAPPADEAPCDAPPASRACKGGCGFFSAPDSEYCSKCSGSGAAAKRVRR